MRPTLPAARGSSQLAAIAESLVTDAERSSRRVTYLLHIISDVTRVRHAQGTTLSILRAFIACAAAVVSAVVLRRPTKEYTHRYSMVHRGLTTAGIEVAPHHHQLLVRIYKCTSTINNLYTRYVMYMRTSIIMRPFFAFRQKNLFITGRTSIECQK